MTDFSISTPKGVRRIGPGEPVFVVAEMSGNHNQNLETAYKIIDAAAEAGADAIKLQTYTADTITIDCDNEYFRIKEGPWAGQTLYELYQRAYTPWEWHGELKIYAEGKGLVFFSTPFDGTAVDFLERLGVSLYKVASFEVVDIPLLQKIGQTKKPVIMSCGMATEEEINLAVTTLRKFGSPAVALLYCVSAYPANAEDMNLATVPELAKRFNAPAGLSDHSLILDVPLTAVDLGAVIIEKHLTLTRSDGGPDAEFSLEPYEFEELVEAVRCGQKGRASIGVVKFGPGISEKGSLIYRKSLFVVQPVKKGEVFTSRNIRSIRPGHGLPPKLYDEIMGDRAVTDISPGTPLVWKLIKKS